MGEKNRRVHQLNRQAGCESEREQNVSAALGSCCHCRAAVISPNSPTETR